jgi:CheY-like chemotaxis protein
MTGIQGTGVGLSLSRALCEAMNGTLSFESTVGAGATFTVNVPRATLEAVTGEHVGLGPRVATDPSAGVILYVEDNLANLRLVERVMRSRPETLQVALQGAICVELAREIHPKLILLDIHLPDISGDEVLRRLRADPATADIAVVILSADVSPRRAQRLLDEGASDYLPKPIDVRRLVTILDRLQPPAGQPASASADAGGP